MPFVPYQWRVCFIPRFRPFIRALYKNIETQAARCYYTIVRDCTWAGPIYYFRHHCPRDYSWYLDEIGDNVR